MKQKAEKAGAEISKQKISAKITWLCFQTLLHQSNTVLLALLFEFDFNLRKIIIGMVTVLIVVACTG